MWNPYQTLPDPVLAVRNPLGDLVWCGRSYHSLPKHRSGSPTILLCYYQHLPAAELNTHMISSILFYIAIVGLLAYAAYLKHQIKKK